MQDQVDALSTAPPTAAPSYDEDFYAWTQHLNLFAESA
ncbi:MAG: hypothetical protein ETSY1_16250 [Candidatus Entotheonella factor]|uniref:Uncharacterized protein n=1 Tax=Entotheonella factor TaxID=1429438 RepID=W4LM75_ENTF1|nr:MAG: hypothetical protein ETSY1_16250 [Candidatus Entotheonella factor]